MSNILTQFLAITDDVRKKKQFLAALSQEVAKELGIGTHIIDDWVVTVVRCKPDDFGNTFVVTAKRGKVQKNGS